MTIPVRKRNASIHWLTKTIARTMLFPFFKLRTEGQGNLPTKSAFILLPKHQRWEDIPLLSLAAPRPLYYIAKYELFRHFISGWVLSSAGGIPLNRARPLESRRSLKMMVEFLREGDGVVIFPEGTYYKNRMGPGHAGLVRMILSRFTLPLIPVGIRYTAEKGRTHVLIDFGKPIYQESTANSGEFIDLIIKEISILSGL